MTIDKMASTVDAMFRWFVARLPIRNGTYKMLSDIHTHTNFQLQPHTMLVWHTRWNVVVDKMAGNVKQNGRFLSRRIIFKYANHTYIVEMVLDNYQHGRYKLFLFSLLLSQITKKILSTNRYKTNLKMKMNHYLLTTKRMKEN